MSLNLVSIVLVMAVIFSSVVLATASVQNQAYALSRFFNCMTEIANSNHLLTVQDVNSCYAKEFH